VTPEFGMTQAKRRPGPISLFAIGALAALAATAGLPMARAQPRVSRPAWDAAALPPFNQWLAQIWPEARARGVSRATFDRATRDIKPNLSLPDLRIPGRPSGEPKGQAEFIKTPAEYLDEGSLRRLASRGKTMLARYSAALDAIERRFGVSRYVVLAIWGRETAFGSHKLRHNAMTVLATQAYVGRRKEQFREEFMVALTLLERGVVHLEDMRSSWAGAMGPTQFMPSDYERYAVSLDGAGPPNPWTSVPDALASAANQLLKNNWEPGKAWAYEARVPADFDCSLASQEIKKPIREWLQMGVSQRNGHPVSAGSLGDPASMLTPAGRYGPAFIASQNFYAIKAYNTSDLYVLFVGQLADRIEGKGAFGAPWGKVRKLKSADVEEMQRRLMNMGLYHDKLDGKAGSRTRAAVGAYQKAHKLKLDCWPTQAILAHMRKQR
jgi:lytic murein transglycosylase